MRRQCSLEWPVEWQKHEFFYWPDLVGKDIVVRFIIGYSSLRDFGR
jgi:hypothetical protein